MSDEPATALTPSDPSSTEATFPLTLTILAHPEVRRLGAQAHWYRHDLSLCRTAPNFGGRPIEDTHVSRTPVTIHRVADHVILKGGSDRVNLNGVPFEPGTVLGPPELRQGVVISLGSYVHVLLREGLEARAALPGVHGPSPELERIRRVVSARRAHSLLLVGPEGSGKSHIARAVIGPGALRVVHLEDGCPSWDDISGVRGGTLVLEDVDRAPPGLQALALRVFEEWSFGGEGVGCRVILTARNEARIRSDLRHRLTCIRLEPLVRRREDAAAQLGVELLTAFQSLHGTPPPPGWLRPLDMLDLVVRAWPGNSQQLAMAARLLVDAYGRDPHADLAILGDSEPAPPDLRVVDGLLLQRLQTIIEQRLAEASFGVDQLAREMATSPRHLHRTALRLCGCSPIELIRKHRMEEANRLLCTATYSTVAEVAAAVGLSPAHFSRVYQGYFGRSPSEDLRR